MQNYCHANAALKQVTCDSRARGKQNNRHFAALNDQHYCGTSLRISRIIATQQRTLNKADAMRQHYLCQDYCGTSTALQRDICNSCGL